MNKALGFFLVIFLFAPLTVWCGGAAEAAEAEASAGGGRGKYLAGQGIIIPSSEVHVNSYVASIDYNYPDPTEELGVTLYSGHRQISIQGQNELVQIGIQGRKLEFEQLPPLNLAFVIDKSGSMSAANKMDWVKDAFGIFIERVRDIDFVSLIVFDNSAKVVFPSTQMKSRDRRLQFRQAVDSVQTGGGTNLVDGLELGYQQVLANYRSEYTNRVLFLTDGVGESGGLLDMAETYRELGINVSTIGVGTDFDLELMVELARRGGGSSRFIANREGMEDIFGGELDRMVVAVARNLEMTLEFLQPVEILGTWGYSNRIAGQAIHYGQETLHHRDYETILAEVRLLPGGDPGARDLARFTIDYEDLQGNRHRSGPHTVSVEFVDSQQPVAGYSSGIVLQSGTMLRFAQKLQIIGELYYSCREQIEEINRSRDELWRQRGGDTAYDEISSPEIRSLEEAVASKMQRAIDLTVEMKKELTNARLRLDNEGFDDEIEILEQYIDILGAELQWDQSRVTTTKSDLEIRPGVPKRSLQEQLSNLFREMTLELNRIQGGVVAVSGFATKAGKPAGLVDLLNEMAMVEFGRIDTLTLVERNRLDELLAEQELALSDLMDTENAIEIGKFLAADYIVTGSVIEMANTVVVFGRVINVATAEVESVAQVILPKDADLIRLLI